MHEYLCFPKPKTKDGAIIKKEKLGISFGKLMYCQNIVRRKKSTLFFFSMNPLILLMYYSSRICQEFSFSFENNLMQSQILSLCLTFNLFFVVSPMFYSTHFLSIHFFFFFNKVIIPVHLECCLN